MCVRVYVCVYVLACRQESLRNDSGSEREAVGCVFGRTTENSEIIVHYGIFSIIDRTSYRGQNYRINTIIIVHLATLFPTLFLEIWCNEENYFCSEGTGPIILRA